jgi:adenosylhomocysteine nucleosidase
MTRIAIIAALAGEMKPLVRGWGHERRNGVDVWRWGFDQGEWVAACAGAGQAAATRAFAEAEKAGPINQVISTGWAGALREDLQTGRAYRVSGVIDARTGERFATSDEGGDCLLVTSPKVADGPEKQRLAAAYSGALVDMEAAAIARLAHMREIPFYCVKGISDGYNDQLHDFNRFIESDGQFQLSRFVLFSFLRPWYWPALIQMGENSRKAAQSIAESLLELLDERGQIRERNGYPNPKH